MENRCRLVVKRVSRLVESGFIHLFLSLEALRISPLFDWPIYLITADSAINLGQGPSHRESTADWSRGLYFENAACSTHGTLVCLLKSSGQTAGSTINVDGGPYNISFWFLPPLVYIVRSTKSSRHISINKNGSGWWWKTNFPVSKSNRGSICRGRSRCLVPAGFDGDRDAVYQTTRRDGTVFSRRQFWRPLLFGLGFVSSVPHPEGRRRDEPSYWSQHFSSFTCWGKFHFLFFINQTLLIWLGIRHLSRPCIFPIQSDIHPWIEAENYTYTF